MRTSKQIGMRFTVLILLCGIMFCISGCKNGRRSPTEMLSGALDAEVSLETEDILYRVTVHLGAVNEGGVRDKEIVFLSPDSLSGMTVRENAEGITVTQNGITAKGGESAHALLLAASLFSPDEIVRTEGKNEGRTAYAVYHLSDGRALYFDDNTGALCRVESDSYRASVAWIEAR